MITKAKPIQGKNAITKTHKFDAFIFDIDNVLIDTRKSYLESIIKTVEVYLSYGQIPFFSAGKGKSKKPLLTLEDIEEFKLLGGFNDDWDCTYGLLVYLLSLPVKKRTLDDLREKIAIASFVKKVKKRPLGTSGITDMVGAHSGIKIERIGRIFQEIYLGKSLFTQTEKTRPVFWKKRGLMDREKLVFRPQLLEKLKEAGIQLGIATGRPRFEAIFALRKFEILDYFDAVTTMGEVKAAEEKMKMSLRKPHPFSLIETAKQLGAKKKFLYIGDLPDDVYAANAAKKEINIQSAGFPLFAANPFHAQQELKKAEADFLIQHPHDLLKLAGI